MKTTNLQQEFIKDEFNDCVNLASEIIGCKCCDTVMQGDRDKGDEYGTKYQILPDSFRAKTVSDKVKLAGFEEYFYDNFGKWKERCYFDTPAQAFFNLMKAWHIWNNSLEKEIKNKYIKTSKRIYESSAS